MVGGKPYLHNKGWNQFSLSKFSKLLSQSKHVLQGREANQKFAWLGNSTCS